ncbi:DNA mismatch repair protein mutS [Rickettsiales bacterium Ac37b]|nr:DNA mismatch repair protein mutS [Rickettsiales bacterium Ac37b]
MKTSAVTPMMQQYMSIKEAHQDCLLFYRMGDFYELFFDDAITAASVLDIALTKRGKHEDYDIPMCGVPFHACDFYLHKLIKAGFKVAICEQLETPEQAKKRGYKAIVKREVIRIITPGTILEENLLDSTISNYLASLTKIDNQLALAWIDISTGEFSSCVTNLESLHSDLARINPKELLISEKFMSIPEIKLILQEWKVVITSYVQSFFEYSKCELKLKNFYNILTLDSFNYLSSAEISACGAIVEYITITQKSNVPKLSIPKKLSSEQFMVIDAATRRNLELTITLSGQKNGSVIDVIDKTKTTIGSRLLYQYLSFPLRNAKTITSRLEIVEFFVFNDLLCNNIRDILGKVGDIERASSRLLLNRGGPRDLVTIREGLIQSFAIADLLIHYKETLPVSLHSLSNDLCGFEVLINELREALNDEVPYLVREGGFVKMGYNATIDELQEMQSTREYYLNELKETYRSETGIGNLKIEHNNIIGYYIEVSPQQSSKITAEKFIHKQTLTTGVRYITEELKELETKLFTAQDQVLRLELEIFNALVELIGKHSYKLASLSHALAVLDIMTSFAYLAKSLNYVRPIIDESYEFKVIAGRHPVVEANLKNNIAVNNFVPNNCDLNEKQRVWLLTGPNMAGKSTFLRQNAIIAILAHIGSFVPAEFAHIGVIDRIFSRVGASDDLATGKSTFMVEMVETATILNQATPRSLVILDEIGRGTSTYDGLAIAWSCLEYIHNKFKCRTLFATHYHELTKLVDSLSSLKCYSMKVKEWQEKIIFLHEVIEGNASRSYGIYVAKLAGVPNLVIMRAEQILKLLESANDNTNIVELHDKMPLFMQHKSPNSELESFLSTIDINDLTPKEALEILYKMKNI